MRNGWLDVFKFLLLLFGLEIPDSQREDARGKLRNGDKSGDISPAPRKLDLHDSGGRAGGIDAIGESWK